MISTYYTPIEWQMCMQIVYSFDYYQHLGQTLFDQIRRINRLPHITMNDSDKVLHRNVYNLHNILGLQCWNMTKKGKGMFQRRNFTVSRWCLSKIITVNVYNVTVSVWCGILFVTWTHWPLGDLKKIILKIKLSRAIFACNIWCIFNRNTFQGLLTRNSGHHWFRFRFGAARQQATSRERVY